MPFAIIGRILAYCPLIFTGKHEWTGHCSAVFCIDGEVYGIIRKGEANYMNFGNVRLTRSATSLSSCSTMMGKKTRFFYTHHFHFLIAIMVIGGCVGFVPSRDC